MKFCFAADALNDVQQHRQLDIILNTALDGWHEWKIDDPEILEQSDWFQSSRQYVKDFFEKSVQREAYSASSSLHKHCWFVTSQGDSSDTLAPQAAVHYFTTPLRICVENEFTDRLFVDTVLSLLAFPELKEFFDQFAEGQKKPVEYLHGGGTGELCKLIKRRVGETVAQGIRFRAVTVTDSDARFPGDQERMKKALEIEEVCRNNDIPCIVLNRRTIENYIPDEVLQGWADEPGNQAVIELVNAVCSLTAEQRDHLPMKKKLPIDKKLASEEVALYASIPAQQRDTLARSKFRDDLIHLFKTHKQYLTGDGLRRRDGKEELDRIVAMIAEEL